MKRAEISFQERGEGPALVLVHGWGLNAAVWAPLLPLLEKDFRVFTLDLPGHGRSRMTDALTLEDLAEHLHQTLPAPAVWLGWSLGAMAAIALALRHPDNVSKLVLVGATPKFVQSGDWPEGMPSAVFDDFASELANDYERSLQRFLSLQAGARADREMLRAMRVQLIDGGRPSVPGLQAGLGILRSADLRPGLNALLVPALVMHGERDRLVSMQAAQVLVRGIEQSSLLTFPAAGHAPFLSHPREFASSVRAFIHE